jgi:F-type H+-transporting ATPase subunit c
MKNFTMKYKPVLLTMAAMLLMPELAFAADGADAAGYIAIGSGLLMGLAVIGGALGQGKAISSGLEAVGRNPSAQGKILVQMIIGLAFIELMVLFAYLLSLELIAAVSKSVGA